jgi:predicted RNase H-like HicB family nuclease
MINIQEAAELYLKTLNKKRKKIPLEQSFNNITIDSKKVFEYA